MKRLTTDGFAWGNPFSVDEGDTIRAFVIGAPKMSNLSRRGAHLAVGENIYQIIKHMYEYNPPYLTFTDPSDVVQSYDIRVHRNRLLGPDSVFITDDNGDERKIVHATLVDDRTACRTCNGTGISPPFCPGPAAHIARALDTEKSDDGR